jgi:hypothetical protein
LLVDPLEQAVMTDLWKSSSAAAWREALDAYDDVVVAQGVAALPELDRWYHRDLGAAIVARHAPHVTSAELVKLTEWKMARGVWRAPNLILVRANPSESVIATSTRALAAVPHPTSPIATLAKLDGVGPATASAVVAAFAPQTYPFFDEIVAAQVPGLGRVAWTLKYYGAYAAALRDRAEKLSGSWTPAMVERALWSYAGGKKAVPIR